MESINQACDARHIICHRFLDIVSPAGRYSPRPATVSRNMERPLARTPAVPLIIAIAGNSRIAAYHWQNRGLAPKAYIRGMAVAYGRAYCKFKAGDPAE